MGSAKHAPVERNDRERAEHTSIQEKFHSDQTTLAVERQVRSKILHNSSPTHSTARSLRHSSLLQMQRTYGNASVQHILQRNRIQRCGGEIHAGCSCADDHRKETVLDETDQLMPIVSSSASLSRRGIVQRTGEATRSSITPDYARGLSDAVLEVEINDVRMQLMRLNTSDSLYRAAQDNLRILETEVSQRTLNQLQEQGPDFDPASNLFTRYCHSCETVASLGGSLPPEPEGVLLPGDQMVVMDESGQVQLISGGDFAQIGDDLFPVLDDVANAAAGGALPGAAMGEFQQVLLWPDGRAVLTPPTSGDFASLLVQGQPAEIQSAAAVTNLGRPWERVRDASVHSLWTSGLYQLGSHPIRRFNGVALPPGSRVRFADVGRLVQGQMDSRLITIFERGTKRYYAWDAHAPVPGAKVVHDFYHVNQKGMYNLFGHSDHAPIPPAMLNQARGLRYLRVGGRILFVVGVVVDGALLIDSARQSAEQGSARPLAAQAIRTVGGWGGAWVGAKAGCAVGGLAGVETGPGAVLTCLAGGVIGGFAGYFGADWIADTISPD